ncbi:MAG: NAD(P)H-binding protein, partial [Candidatus Thiodiazotropha sp.]
MHLLITGANGFIGTHLTQALLRQGHRVTAAVRNPGEFRRRHPTARALAVDYNQALQPDRWLPLLEGVDAVINTVGIIRESGKQRFSTLHEKAPIALFRACEAAGVQRVIQISALGADE